jgi:hypothetical protein
MNSVFTQNDVGVPATLQQRTVHYKPDAIHETAQYGPKHVAALWLLFLVCDGHLLVFFVYNMLL